MFSDPIRLLRNYKQEFKYRFMGEALFKGINCDEVQLYPEELGGPYALIKIYFSAASSDLKAVVIRQKEGIIYTMIVNSLKKQDDPGDSYFKFDPQKNPDVEVIELLD